MRFAADLAEANGFSVDDVPPLGLPIQIPNYLIEAHNAEDVVGVYNPNAIVGSLAPLVDVPNRNSVTNIHKHHFFHILLESAIGTALFILTEGFLSPLMADTFGKVMGSILAYAAAGASEGLAGQGAALAFHDINKLDWSSIGRSTALSAVSKVLGDVLQIEKANTFKLSLTQNIYRTILLQGLSSGLGNQSMNWQQFVVALSSTVANVGVGELKIAPELSNALSTTAGTIATLVVDEIINGEYELDTMVAAALGTVIGNQVGNVAKEHYYRYLHAARQDLQIASANNDEPNISQIPALSTQIDSLNDDYFNSLALKPLPHGLISTGHSSSINPNHQRAEESYIPSIHSAFGKRIVDEEVNGNLLNKPTINERELKNHNFSAFSFFKAGLKIEGIIAKNLALNYIYGIKNDFKESKAAFQGGHYLYGTFKGAEGVISSAVLIGSVVSAVRIFAPQRLRFFGGEGTVNLAAHNAADALRLKTTLRLQEVGLLDESGRLTETVIRNAEPALRPGTVLNNNSVVEALTKDGSQITDWHKLTTQSIELSNGQRVQVHFYQNRVTGEINYTHPDFKIKGIVNEFYTPKPLGDNSRYIPSTMQDVLDKYKSRM